MRKVILRVTPIQFATIYAFLFRTKLGDYSPYAKAISGLMEDMEIDGVDEFLSGVDMPDIRVTASDEDGIVFEVI